MAAPKIPLNQILAAMDRKDRDYYNNLDDELKKQFSPFMMLKYVSSLGPPHPRSNLPAPLPDMEQYYIQATNKFANPNMLEISNKEHPHKQLQWLLLTTVSPGMGDQSHVYIKGMPNPQTPATKRAKLLAELYPSMKDDDLNTLSELITTKELNQYIKDHGEMKKKKKKK